MHSLPSRMKKHIPYAVLVTTFLLGTVLASAFEVGTETTDIVVVNPGLYFRTDATGANFSFVQNQSFSSITMTSAQVSFDSVGVRATPANLAAKPNVVFPYWRPPPADEMAFTASSSVPSTMIWFNFTGMLPSSVYNLTVDGQFIGAIDSDSFGFLSVSWSSWSTSHAFDLLLYGATGGGPGGGGGGYYIPPPEAPPTAPAGFPIWTLVIVALVLTAVVAVGAVQGARRR